MSGKLRIKAAFRKYIVDTPEEVATVLARKVQANIMSVFAAVREQHPDWDEEAIYKEANLIYAEKSNELIQVVDPAKPPDKSAVVTECCCVLWRFAFPPLRRVRKAASQASPRLCRFC